MLCLSGLGRYSDALSHEMPSTEDEVAGCAGFPQKPDTGRLTRVGMKTAIGRCTRQGRRMRGTPHRFVPEQMEGSLYMRSHRQRCTLVFFQLNMVFPRVTGCRLLFKVAIVPRRHAVVEKRVNNIP